MKFVDLEKLKIINEYNFVTKELGLELSKADTIFDIKEKVRSALSGFFTPSQIETYFHITLTITAADGESFDNIDDADAFFTTVVNVFTAVFLDEMCVKPYTGRPRERRLDVPEKLKMASISMSLLKKNVNMKTYCNRFNIGIEWTNNGIDYRYSMLPQKGDEDNDN